MGLEKFLTEVYQQLRQSNSMRTRNPANILLHSNCALHGWFFQLLALGIYFHAFQMWPFPEQVTELWVPLRRQRLFYFPHISVYQNWPIQIFFCGQDYYVRNLTLKQLQELVSTLSFACRTFNLMEYYSSRVSFHYLQDAIKIGFFCRWMQISSCDKSFSNRYFLW